MSCQTICEVYLNHAQRCGMFLSCLSLQVCHLKDYGTYGFGLLVGPTCLEMSGQHHLATTLNTHNTMGYSSFL